MPYRIGLLLPRSTDYPAIAYDILDGLRTGMQESGITDVTYHSENIGFGENYSTNYSVAEKLFLNEDVNLVVAYCNAQNAEQLYTLAEGMSKPILFLDAGMQYPDVAPSPFCYHLSLQGINACFKNGKNAGEGGRKVLAATSFYDGGYRGPMFSEIGITTAGGAVCGNYVSGHRLAEFTIESYLTLLTEQRPQAVTATFSSYLAELFLKELKTANLATHVPMYCGPFMAEEQMLARCEHPGGELHTVVAWGSDIKNVAQEKFISAIKNEKNKTATIFHLLGWEAAMVANEVLLRGLDSLKEFEYDTPRGRVKFHPETHYTYAPLFEGKIVADANGKCRLNILKQVSVSAEEHKNLFHNHSTGHLTGWKNNYLCI